jgi:hypothetical protein
MVRVPKLPLSIVATASWMVASVITEWPLSYVRQWAN